MFVSHLSFNSPAFLFLAFFALTSAACTPSHTIHSNAPLLSSPPKPPSVRPLPTSTTAHQTLSPAQSFSAVCRHFALKANTNDKANTNQAICRVASIELQRRVCALLVVDTPSARQQRWFSLLNSLGQPTRCLTGATWQAYRHLLEIEGDRDRNRFSGFPESLSLRIVRTIMLLDLRYRPSHRKIAPSRVASLSLSTQAHSPAHSLLLTRTYRMNSPEPSTSSASAISSAPTIYSAPTTSSMHNAPKGDALDSDTRPPLVFTERDLDRFREPTSFLRWPARGAISSGFGLRSDPFHRKQRFHQGIDIVAPFGSPVFAAAEGVVLHAGWMGSCGMGVLLEHARGYRTLYCHLSQILATPKDPVSSGQRIGSIGSTGRSTGPHLHFGLFLHKHPINPRSYLPRHP